MELTPLHTDRDAVQNLIRSTIEQQPLRNEGVSKLVHAERILGILSEFSEFEDSSTRLILTPGLEMAVLLHDIIFLGTREHQTYNGNFLAKYLSIATNSKSADFSSEALYALAIAEAAEHFESAAEKWRRDIADYCTQEAVEGYEFVEDHLREIYSSTHYFEPGPVQLQSLKRNIAVALDDGGSPISEEMYRFRAPMADISVISEVLDNYDIEALLVKAAEVIDNLRHPNVEKEASAWRDAQELLSFYSPLLDLAGFKRLSNLAKDEALQYLHSGIERKSSASFSLLAKAKSINRQAQEFIDKNQYKIEAILREGWSLFTRNLTDDYDADISWITPRAKGLGSSAEKLMLKDFLTQTLPDAAGFSIFIPEPLSRRNKVLDLFKYSRLVLPLLAGSLENCEIRHVRQNEPAVEIMLGDEEDINNFAKYLQSEGIKYITQKQKLIFTINAGNHTISYEVGPARKETGYESMHMTLTVDGQGVEIQCCHQTEWDMNTYGVSNHVLYKAKYALGEFGKARRERNLSPKHYDDYEVLEGVFLRIAADIRNRSQSLLTDQQKNHTHYILRTASITFLENILQSYTLVPKSEIQQLLSALK